MKYLMRTKWWKWLTMALLVYVVIGGFLFQVPRLPILNETIRVRGPWWAADSFRVDLRASYARRRVALWPDEQCVDHRAVVLRHQGRGHQVQVQSHHRAMFVLRLALMA